MPRERAWPSGHPEDWPAKDWNEYVAANKPYEAATGEPVGPPQSDETPEVDTDLPSDFEFRREALRNACALFARVNNPRVEYDVLPAAREFEHYLRGTL